MYLIYVQSVPCNGRVSDKENLQTYFISFIFSFLIYKILFFYHDNSVHLCIINNFKRYYQETWQCLLRSSMRNYMEHFIRYTSWILWHLSSSFIKRRDSARVICNNLNIPNTRRRTNIPSTCARLYNIVSSLTFEIVKGTIVLGMRVMYIRFAQWFAHVFFRRS